MKLKACYRVMCNSPYEVSPYMFVNRMFFFRFATNDRFDFLTKYSLIDWEECGEQVDPKVFHSTYNVWDIIDRRAKEILDWAERENKKIYVLYSGGVDSTCVAVALLKNRNKQVVELIGTKESIDENPVFYELMKKQKVTVHILQWADIYPFITKHDDYILTNGWGADQLHHYGATSKYPELFNKSWIEGTKAIYEERGQLDYWLASKQSIEIIEDYLDHVFPAPIKSFNYYCWFWNFCMKYQFIRYVNTLESDSEYHHSHNIPFFINKEFSDWGASRWEWYLHYNYNEALHYKPDLKAYTIDYTKDSNWWYKNKTQSWDPMYERVNTSRMTVIDEEGFKNLGDIEQHKKYKLLLQYYAKPGVDREVLASCVKEWPYTRMDLR